MKTVADVFVRTLAVVALLVLTAFCEFGFLASFEYPGITVWHVVYAVLGLTFATLTLLNLRRLFRQTRKLQ